MNDTQNKPTEVQRLSREDVEKLATQIYAFDEPPLCVCGRELKPFLNGGAFCAAGHTFDENGVSTGGF